MVNRMPFGRYRGWSLADLPDDYFAWLLSLTNLRPWLAHHLGQEAARRDSGREPHARTYQPPRAARQRPALKDVDAVISAGQRSLARTHHPDVGGDADRMKSINHAVDWLHICAKDQLI